MSAQWGWHQERRVEEVAWAYNLYNTAEAQRMLTLCEVVDANVIELLHFFHDQLLLVDLDHHRGMPSISPGESELAEGGFQLLRNVDGMGLSDWRW